MIQVTTVQAAPDHQLVLTLNNGERRRFDMHRYLRYPVFHRLANTWVFAIV